MRTIDSTYTPPFVLKSAHLNTITPNLFRKVTGVEYQRIRVETWDGDFIDLDISSRQSKNAVVILHGLEGNSNRAYARGMVKAVNQTGRDAIVMNQRGCSGEPNRLVSAYHSGKTDDLDYILNHLYNQYESIDLIGFSLGGNIILKYLGEQATTVHQKIGRSVAISTPIDLKDSATQLGKFQNQIYMRRFMKTLRQKTLFKIHRFPNCGIHETDLIKCKTFTDFDNLYTAPIHGFQDAEDYWNKCSSLFDLGQIQTPTLLINALDDPFLGKNCYPNHIQNDLFHLIMPKYGGHVGFGDFPLNSETWLEKTCVQFLAQ